MFNNKKKAESVRKSLISAVIFIYASYYGLF